MSGVPGVAGKGMPLASKRDKRGRTLALVKPGCDLQGVHLVLLTVAL